MASDGYAWWYLDAVSDDRRHAIAVIAMLGSAFSPSYAAQRKRRAADPLDFVAMNVAVYGPLGRRWALTERRGASRTAEWLAIGPSSMRWERGALVVDVDEITVPFASRLRGRIRVEPEWNGGAAHRLDAAGAHRWWPIAPRARVSVELKDPAIRWAGDGYLDANTGEEPLEEGFRSWQWSRVAVPGGAVVSYAVERRDGSSATLDLRFDGRGEVPIMGGLTDRRLAKTRWRLDRSARSAAPVPLVRTLEDTPFYARSLVEIEAEGRRGVAVHETLSLERFEKRWVRALLPARIRRVVE